jgi:hypothetical protein
VPLKFESFPGCEHRPARRVKGKLAFLDTIEQHALVRIFTLAILALLLCSCADSYEIFGLHLKPAADGDRDGFGHGYVSGAGDPT